MSHGLRHLWQNWTQGAAEAAAARARARLAAHPWPAPVLEVLARLRDGGHAAYLVGGTVRDVLIGRAAGAGIDVATDLRPEDVMTRFARVEPTGLRHGTVTIVEQQRVFECTTFRREGAYSDARRPDSVAFTHDPIEDLARRDLTVNALAFDPAAGALLDPHEGALDLERRVLRAVGDPLERFREDALRPLRVARFTATLEMEPDPALREALAAIRPESEDRPPEGGVRFDAVAAERVREELHHLLAARQPSRGFEVMREAGLLELWLPELARCRGVVQNRFHAYDVYYHSLYTCDAAVADKLQVRWAALLHDIGKPDTRAEKNGEGTFYNHQFVGAELADRLLERLREPLDLRRQVVHLVREHMFDYRAVWSDAALRRWLRRVGTDQVADLFDLRIADMIGNGLKQGFPRYLDPMRRRITALLAEVQALHVEDLEVDGNDVMRELGIGPGRAVGEALEALLEEVLDDPSHNRREFLLARMRARRSGGGRDA